MELVLLTYKGGNYFQFLNNKMLKGTTFDDERIVNDLIDHVIDSSNHHCPVVREEIKNFLPAILNVISKDEYVNNIIDNIPENFANLKEIPSQTDQELIEELEFSENDSYQRLKEIIETLYNKKKRGIIFLFLGLKKIFKIFDFIKSGDVVKESDNFNWQQYIASRRDEIENHQQKTYQIEIIPNKKGLNFNIIYDKNKILEIDLTKYEIQLLASINNIKHQNQKIQNQSPLNQEQKLYHTNHVNELNERNNKKRWTDWQEIKREDKGDHLIITLQSKYIETGRHDHIPSL